MIITGLIIIKKYNMNFYYKIIKKYEIWKIIIIIIYIIRKLKL